MVLLSLYSVGSPQSNESEDPDILVELKFRELREIDKQTQEYPILKSLIEEQKTQIAELKKALEDTRKTVGLDSREIELLNQKIQLMQQALDMKDKAFNDMKDVADRAIKLAETSKPSTNIWQIIGMVLGGIAIGLAIGAL